MFFSLEPEDNSDRIYYFEILIKGNDFEDIIYDSEFENFMDKMETDRATYAGVHDIAVVDTKVWGYSSYEIEDFQLAIEMWYDWFKSKGFLSKNSIIKTKVINSYDDVN